MAAVVRLLCNFSFRHLPDHVLSQRALHIGRMQGRTSYRSMSSGGAEKDNKDSKIAEEHVKGESQEDIADAYTPFPDDINPVTGEEGGPRGPEPTRYGDWERKGRCIDF